MAYSLQGIYCRTSGPPQTNPVSPLQPPTGQPHLNGKHHLPQEAPSLAEEATPPAALLAHNRDNPRQDKPSRREWRDSAAATGSSSPRTLYYKSVKTQCPKHLPGSSMETPQISCHSQEPHCLESSFLARCKCCLC